MLELLFLLLRKLHCPRLLPFFALCYELRAFLPHPVPSLAAPRYFLDLLCSFVLVG